jgi:hypothetical protein
MNPMQHWADAEFSRIHLGDKRLNKRFRPFWICEKIKMQIGGQKRAL